MNNCFVDIFMSHFFNSFLLTRTHSSSSSSVCVFICFAVVFVAFFLFASSSFNNSVWILFENATTTERFSIEIQYHFFSSSFFLSFSWKSFVAVWTHSLNGFSNHMIYINWLMRMALFCFHIAEPNLKLLRKKKWMDIYWINDKWCSRR